MLPIPRSCMKSFSSLIVSGPCLVSGTARCRCSRCELSLCSPFEPLLQESKALKSKVYAVSQYWILTECVEPHSLYFLVGKQSQTKRCLSLLLGKVPSKMKCLEDFLILHLVFYLRLGTSGKVMLYYVSLVLEWCEFLGLFCFSSLPVEMFGFRILHTSMLLEESINYSKFICRN